MREYASEELRNVALAGHSGAGKTTLAESILYAAKAVERLGRVEEGNTTSDYDPEEARRQISINAALLPVPTATHKINLLDVPGSRDFLGEIRNCLYVADSCVLAVDANHPAEGGTEFVWSYCEEFGLPVAVFVNKLDKERADLEKTIEALRHEFEANFFPIALPIGANGSLKGVVDILKMKAIIEKDGKSEEQEIPADMKEAAQAARSAMVEAAAEGDDALMEKFLSDEALTPEEIATGLRESVAARRAFPVLCGSAARGIGVRSLLDFAAAVLPSPLEGAGIPLESGDRQKVDGKQKTSLFVFKTVADDFAGRLNFFKVVTGDLRADAHLINTHKEKDERIAHPQTMLGRQHHNMDHMAAGDLGAVAKLHYSATGDTLRDSHIALVYKPCPMPKPTSIMAIHSASKTDEEKIGMGLHRLVEQDPTLTVRRDPETAETLISGMGDTHLDVAVSRLKSHIKVELHLSVPQVAYREAITHKAEGQGKYKKQSGGRGQYGDCWLRLEPNERGAGHSFEWKVVGGAVPTKFAPAIEKGLFEAFERGVLAGYPTVDIKAACYDGSYHNVDSSEMAFKVAASMAFKHVAPLAGPIILEPIVDVAIDIPDQYMGDVMGDLSQRRGRVLGSEPTGKRQKIRAQAPLSEMYTYSRDLRSMTQGRGRFEMDFSHYDPVPGDVQHRIIEGSTKRKEEETA